MKRMKIIVAMALVCLMVLSAAGAGAAGWQSGSRGWWYENTDGSYPANQWQRIDGDWYYFDASGWMVTGWKKISGSWYYFESSGAMMTGWQRIDEQYYYFDGSGVMQTGWIEDGGKQYYLDENGVWVDGGEEQTGGPTYSNAGYWGRATLENDNLRAAYDRIWLGIEQMEKSIDLRSYKLSYSQFSNVMSTYEMEHGEHFWYANEYYYYTSGGIVTKVEPAYYSFSDLAAAKALQKYLNEKYKTSLAVDGVIGAKTKAAMTDNKVCVKKGDSGDLVYLLQGMLYCRSYDPNGFDGDFGSGTVKGKERSFRRRTASAPRVCPLLLQRLSSVYGVTAMMGMRFSRHISTIWFSVLLLYTLCASAPKLSSTSRSSPQICSRYSRRVSLPRVCSVFMMESMLV